MNNELVRLARQLSEEQRQVVLDKAGLYMGMVELGMAKVLPGGEELLRVLKGERVKRQHTYKPNRNGPVKVYKIEGTE